MWFWWRRKKEAEDLTVHTGEIEQAQQIRDEANQEMFELYVQKPEVDSLVRKLARRRVQNHFGEEMHISFTRRGGAA